MQKLRVWWIPQVPGKPFYVAVDTVAEGVKLTNILAMYDLFQFNNRIKPDYCNMGGLHVFEDSEAEWVDWYSEDGEYDDPEEWLKTQANQTA